MPTRMGPNFANPQKSCFANPEGPHFCKSGIVLFLSTRKGIILEDSFLLIRKVTRTPIWKGANFTNLTISQKNANTP